MKRHAGFTLVELLLAVTLLGLLLAMAYGGLRAASRASTSGQAVLEESSRLRITHQFLRKQLNLMLPLTFASVDGSDGQPVRFEGTADRVVFVGPMPGYLARGGPRVQQLALVEGDEGLELHFTHAPFDDFEPEYLYDSEPVVLFTGLRGGEFSFLQADPTVEPDEEALSATWVGAWGEPTVMPEAVRIDLAFEDDARVHWPPLVASSRLDATAIVPGAGGETYAEKIQEMIRNSRGGDERR